LFRLGGTDGDQPGWRGGLGGGGFLEIGLGQNRLLKVSYYKGSFQLSEKLLAISHQLSPARLDKVKHVPPQN
jgi:hypothetical protein